MLAIEARRLPLLSSGRGWCPPDGATRSCTVNTSRYTEVLPSILRALIARNSVGKSTRGALQLKRSADGYHVPWKGFARGLAFARGAVIPSARR